MSHALRRPSWANVTDIGDGPFVLHYTGPKGPEEDLDEDDHASGRCGDHVDLSHPAGWDHAMRAYTTIGKDGALYFKEGTAQSVRHEALCRAICTALGLDVDVVFPVERA